MVNLLIPLFCKNINHLYICWYLKHAIYIWFQVPHTARVLQNIFLNVIAWCRHIKEDSLSFTKWDWRKCPIDLAAEPNQHNWPQSCISPKEEIFLQNAQNYKLCWKSFFLIMFCKRFPFQIMRWKTLSYTVASFFCIFLMRENIKKLRPSFRARRSPKFLAKNRFSVTSVRYYIIYIMQNAVM